MGHRIRVQDVYVRHELLGQSADEIVAAFPQITHADVYAALAYFWDNRDSVIADMRAEEELAEHLKRQYPSQLRQKLGMQDSGEMTSPP